jgi:hypothetical protein
VHASACHAWFWLHVGVLLEMQLEKVSGPPADLGGPTPLAHADLGGHPLCSVLTLCPGNLNTSAASPCTRAALSQPAAGADRRVALTPDTVAMVLQLIVITYRSIHKSSTILRPCRCCSCPTNEGPENAIIDRSPAAIYLDACRLSRQDTDKQPTRGTTDNTQQIKH